MKAWTVMTEEETDRAYRLLWAYATKFPKLGLHIPNHHPDLSNQKLEVEKKPESEPPFMTFSIDHLYEKNGKSFKENWDDWTKILDEAFIKVDPGNSSFYALEYEHDHYFFKPKYQIDSKDRKISYYCDGEEVFIFTPDMSSCFFSNSFSKDGAIFTLIGEKLIQSTKFNNNAFFKILLRTNLNAPSGIKG